MSLARALLGSPPSVKPGNPTIHRRLQSPTHRRLPCCVRDRCTPASPQEILLTLRPHCSGAALNACCPVQVTTVCKPVTPRFTTPSASPATAVSACLLADRCASSNSCRTAPGFTGAALLLPGLQVHHRLRTGNPHHSPPSASLTAVCRSGSG